MNSDAFSDKVIIGLSGKKRSGKDTVADFLVDQYAFTKMPFAEPIKVSASLIFGFTDEQLYGGLKEKEDDFWGFTPRWAMQMVGTDLFRDQIDPDVWVKSMQRRIARSSRRRIVISDVRFPNEAQVIKEMGGYVARIRRPSVEPVLQPWKVWAARHLPFASKLLGLGPEYHPSETAMDSYDDFDFYIPNRSSRSALLQNAERLVRKAMDKKYPSGRVPLPIEREPIPAN